MSDPTPFGMPAVDTDENARRVSAGSNSGSLRSKIVIGIVGAVLGIGASLLSCVGQSFSLRQARAQEDIAQQLKAIRESCLASPKTVEEAR